ncbi:MAG TPA: glutamate formimidoyltransferase [Bacteroidia bacterium]|nr:glutamate formimidoyltransferase [Bacteroidia bacterium]HQP01876.1 glutamate formimidoyltransferase [Bacteroidia bacterium]
MKQLIECVPNFSEGNDLTIIKQITDSIESVEGIKLLNVDPGKATNRTVVTFVGEPAAVVEAAFKGIAKASELIDMSKHKGEHPRMGATDVCPFIPVANISMQETVEWSKKLAARVGNELHIPVYLYEEAQENKERSNLSIIRAGEYEGFFRKIKQKEWKPDFGPAELPANSGATVIGARDFLIAYNVNLNTKSVKRANSVAFDIREAGRVKTDSKGKKILDDAGNEIRIPGKLKGVKAIGWYIEEYGIAQVSINITKFRETPLHIVFEESARSAYERGYRATGSELVGLVPLQAMLDAGKYFLNKQRLSSGVSDAELIHIAVKSMGLDELSPFTPEKRIIEYVMESESKAVLANMRLNAFVDETASESPAPGGGSIAAYCGSLGVALATMVANLSASKKGWEERWNEFSDWADKGQKIKKQLLHLVDEDTVAFNKIMDAFKLPKATDQEKADRKQAVAEATRYAIEVPLSVMKISLQSMELIEAMATNGNPNSVSDAGVGAMCARTAVLGAGLNVRINAAAYSDKTFVETVLKQAAEMENKAIANEKNILDIVNRKISGL